MIDMRGALRRWVSDNRSRELSARATAWIANSREQVANSVGDANKRSTEVQVAKFGQFFDRDDNAAVQVGIYGTAFVAAILHPREGDSEFSDVFERLARALPGWSGASDACISAADLALTLKCAAVLNAAPWSAEPSSTDDRLSDHLKRMLIETREEKAPTGWGYYSPQITTMAQRPRVFPTAHLIFSALHSKDGASADDFWSRPVLWLAQRVQNDGDRTDLENAMVLLALKSSLCLKLHNRESMDLIEKSISTVAERLLKSVSDVRSSEVVGYYAHVQYPAPDLIRSSPHEADQRENPGDLSSAVESETHKYRYMFYPVHVMIALSLIWAGPSDDGSKLPDEARRYVYAVVDWLLAQTNTGREFFPAAATGRESVSDTFWISLLMAEVVKYHNEAGLTLATRGARILKNRWFLWVVAISAFIFIFFAVYLITQNLGTASVSVLVAIGLRAAFALVGKARSK